jgi:hypothetical protein
MWPMYDVHINNEDINMTTLPNPFIPVMHKWDITETYLRCAVTSFTVNGDDDLIAQTQQFADSCGNNIGVLRCENFTDEMHFYFTRNNRTRIFMRVQYEGTV